MIRSLVWVLFLLVANSVYGLDFESYSRLIKRSDSANRAVVNSHLDAIATSFVTYERLLFQAHGRRLICLPNNLRLSPMSIEIAIERGRKLYPQRDLSSYPVSELAFIGLAAQYPCIDKVRVE